MSTSPVQAVKVLTPSEVFPEGAGPVPGSAHEKFVADRLQEVGMWGTETFSECVRRHATEQPDRVAFTDGILAMTWAELDAAVDLYAAVFVKLGLARGTRVGVVYPDGAVVHALYLATERAGLTAVGIGPRAGFHEVEHLLKLTGSSVLVSGANHLGDDTVELAERLKETCQALQHHLVIASDTGAVERLDGESVDAAWLAALPAVDPELALTLGEVFLLNSTSGTTGMPKCVAHHQNRLLYWYRETLKTASLTKDDVVLGLVPTSYGFGIWTAHAIPILLGATTVMQPKFETESAVRLIEEYKATVLIGVTTQFIKMLNAESMADTDTSSLRVMYTGGEAIPYHRAVEFEQRTGARVLNFYGSNETGMLSYTTAFDTDEHRLTTGGHTVAEMDVVLFDAEGNVVEGVPGRSACRGPASSLGYYGDAKANDELFTDDGYMLTGDLCTIDDEGFLRVVGRTSSFIIRGGKNISEAAVEEAVGAHHAVAVVAAVGVPDPIYGEKVRAVVELRSDEALTLDELKEFLADRKVSKELWPEQLQIVGKLPISSGGKVAKGELRKDLAKEVQHANPA